jgi:hypothetical protein
MRAYKSMSLNGRALSEADKAVICMALRAYAMRCDGPARSDLEQQVNKGLAEIALKLADSIAR